MKRSGGRRCSAISPKAWQQWSGTTSLLELAARKLWSTATVITWRLKALVDAPVQVSDGVLVLQ